MFDSSLRLDSPSGPSLGAGAAFSASTHAAVIAAVLFAASHAAPPKLDAPEVVFRMAPAPAPPPPPPLGGAAQAHTEPKKKPVHVTPDTYVPVTTAKQVV